MIKVKELVSKIKSNYALTSKAKMYLRVQGDNKKYILNGYYPGVLETGERFIALHNQNESSETILAIDFAHDLIVNNHLWDDTSILTYDNSVECNMISDIKLTKSSVTLIVAGFKPEVRSRY